VVSVTFDGTIFTLVETVIFLSTSIQLKLLINFMESECLSMLKSHGCNLLI
jgi:hypothetical protein